MDPANPHRLHAIRTSNQQMGTVYFLSGGGGNQRAHCQGRGHKNCKCWVVPKRNVAFTTVGLLRDLICWLAEDVDEAKHKQSSFDLKVKYGIKPRG